MSSAAKGAAAAVRTAGEWGLHVAAVSRVRKVWRLETDQGVFCLKRSPLALYELIFTTRVVEYLRKRGYYALASIPTRTGAIGAVRPDGVYQLYPWIQSREADLDQADELTLTARALVELYETSRGFIPFTSDPIRVRWGLWPRILAARLWQLADFGARAAAVPGCEFCADYARSFPYFYAQAQLALATLAASPYRELCRDAVRDRTICHHDLSGRNLLLDQENRPTVVDFDYCLADLRIHDLANLLLRRVRHNNWRPEAAAAVLAAYESYTKIDPREYAVLYPFLLWPQDFWQVGLQFFLEKPPWPAERFLRSLRHKTECRDERAAFLEWFRVNVK